jgi:hypothetical protein
LLSQRGQRHQDQHMHRWHIIHQTTTQWPFHPGQLGQSRYGLNVSSVSRMGHTRL